MDTYEIIGQGSPETVLECLPPVLSGILVHIERTEELMVKADIRADFYVRRQLDEVRELLVSIRESVKEMPNHPW